MEEKLNSIKSITYNGVKITLNNKIIKEICDAINILSRDGEHFKYNIKYEYKEKR